MGIENVIKATSLEKIVRLENGESLKVLNDVSFEANLGQFTSIVGPSGSGKTTLLQAISGLSKPSAGGVSLLGVDPYKLKGKKLAEFRRDTIGFVFQSYNLIPALPAVENVLLPLRLSRKKVDVSEAIGILKKLEFKADVYSFVGSLSGGEQQKVAIARVLLSESQVIFADEPTGALDSASKNVVFDLLRNLASQGKCVIMVTHDIEMAAKTDRAIVMRDGQLYQDITNPEDKQLFDLLSMGGK